MVIDFNTYTYIEENVLAILFIMLVHKTVCIFTLWSCVELCGYPSCMELCGAVWSCVELCGVVWSCVELCGVVWYQSRNQTNSGILYQTVEMVNEMWWRMSNIVLITFHVSHSQ